MSVLAFKSSLPWATRDKVHPKSDFGYTIKSAVFSVQIVPLASFFILVKTTVFVKFTGTAERSIIRILQERVFANWSAKTAFSRHLWVWLDVTPITLYFSDILYKQVFSWHKFALTVLIFCAQGKCIAEASVMWATVSNFLHPLTAMIKAVNDLCLALRMFSCICYPLQPFLWALWGKCKV